MSGLSLTFLHSVHFSSKFGAVTIHFVAFLLYIEHHLLNCPVSARQEFSEPFTLVCRTFFRATDPVLQVWLCCSLDLTRGVHGSLTNPESIFLVWAYNACCVRGAVVQSDGVDNDHLVRLQQLHQDRSSDRQWITETVLSIVRTPGFRLIKLWKWLSESQSNTQDRRQFPFSNSLLHWFFSNVPKEMPCHIISACTVILIILVSFLIFVFQPPSEPIACEASCWLKPAASSHLLPEATLPSFLICLLTLVAYNPSIFLARNAVDQFLKFTCVWLILSSC